MFQKILTWIREVFGKMLNLGSVKQAFKLDVAITTLMSDALQKWSLIYQNDSPWLSDDIKSLNLGAAIVSEVANTVTLEMAVNISGSPRADYLSAQIKPVLDNLRTYTEYAGAKGGLWFKPYIKDGNLVTDFVQADQGYPMAFDANGNMTAVVFADQKTIGQTYYTRLEYHALVAGGYEITNRVFKSSTRDTLGTEVPIATVEAWAELEPWAFIENVEQPLFAYFKMPFANNIDTTSPLGVSVYSRAADGDDSLLKQADVQWSNFLWEFESGKRALYTDPTAFAKGTDNKPVLPDKRLYRLLDLQTSVDGKGLFEEWSPTLREVNLLNGLDAILRRVEFTCGLSYGILSNPEAVALTATEIKAGKQRYYVTISGIQKSLQAALDNLLYAMDVWATLGNLAPRGTYQAIYKWGDSILTDQDVQFTQDLQVLDRVMSRVEFRMRNYDETEKVAREKIAWLDEEKKNNQPTDFFPVSA